MNSIANQKSNFINVPQSIKYDMKYYTQYVDKKRCSFGEYLLTSLIDDDDFDNLFVLRTKLKTLLGYLLYKERRLENEKKSLCDV